MDEGSLLQRLWLPAALLAAITATGTLGYVLVEGMSAWDALYMTVITLSTVGYREVQPLSRPGQAFTIGLIVTAVGAALYLLMQMAQAVFELNLRRLFSGKGMQHAIDELSEHVIVCGFGRLGRIVAGELRRAGVAVVAIESDPLKEAELQRAGIPYLIGSAADDQLLRLAGIARARDIVIATSSDSDNVFITLSARELNARIRIHARGESDAALGRLRLAGADQVVSAYQIGGLRMANAVLRPAVVDFLEIAHPRSGAEVDLEEIRVGQGSVLAGRGIDAIEADTPNLRIVALRRGEERVRIAPQGPVAAGDHLVVIGERPALERLASLAARG